MWLFPFFVIQSHDNKIFPWYIELLHCSQCQRIKAWLNFILTLNLYIASFSKTFAVEPFSILLLWMNEFLSDHRKQGVVITLLYIFFSSSKFKLSFILYQEREGCTKEYFRNSSTNNKVNVWWMTLFYYFIKELFPWLLSST